MLSRSVWVSASPAVDIADFDTRWDLIQDDPVEEHPDVRVDETALSGDDGLDHLREHTPDLRWTLPSGHSHPAANTRPQPSGSTRRTPATAPVSGTARISSADTLSPTLAECHVRAVLEMGDAVLKQIAVDCVWAVRSSATIDWSRKESVRASMRAKVGRLLAKYDYPPDHEGRAVDLVLEQAGLFATSTQTGDAAR